jgi:hypothetical protein
MYNRLLFDCPQVSVDVIFAAVSNQCPQRPPEGKLFPYPQVAAEGLIEIRKEAFFERAGVANRIVGFEETQDVRFRSRSTFPAHRVVSIPKKRGTWA